MPYVQRYRKGYTVKPQGIKVAKTYYNKPGAMLPKWVREIAESRGYGDSTQPLSLYINAGDIEEAFACAAQGNGSSCVMAQAGRRIGAKSVYFYRTTAWVDFGEGPLIRFATSNSIYRNVIEPFDQGDRESIAPGIYHLMPPSKQNSIARSRGRARNPDRRGKGSNAAPAVVSHTERIVMASRQAS